MSLKNHSQTLTTPWLSSLLVSLLVAINWLTPTIVMAAEVSIEQARQQLEQAKGKQSEWLVTDFKVAPNKAISLSKLLKKAEQAVAAGQLEEGQRLAAQVIKFSKLALEQNQQYTGVLPYYSKPEANLAAPPVIDQNYLSIGIVKGRSYEDIQYRGQTIRIQRVQDTNNRLSDDFTLTSRPCPPFCIQPATVAEGVQTVAELEIIDFLGQDAISRTGYLVDARMPSVYAVETLPGAINIPFILFSSAADLLLTQLGAKKAGDIWDFSAASELWFFCNGPWCQQSPRAVLSLLDMGYPAAKLKHYRGGLQAWKSFGLTTIQTEENQVSR